MIRVEIFKEIDYDNLNQYISFERFLSFNLELDKSKPTEKVGGPKKFGKRT